MQERLQLGARALLALVGVAVAAPEVLRDVVAAALERLAFGGR